MAEAAEAEERKRKRKRSRRKKKKFDDFEENDHGGEKVAATNKTSEGGNNEDCADNDDGDGGDVKGDADSGKNEADASGGEGEAGEEEAEGTAPTKRKRKRKRKKKGSSNPAASEAGEGGGTPADREKKLASSEYTVYVEGIPFDCTEESVKDFFSSNGVEDVLEMRLPRWQDSGRLRGYGHVVFDSTASRDKALKDLNGLNLGRRYITIKEPNPPRPGTTASAMQPNASGASKPREQPEGCRTVFVKNLPYDATEENVHDAFRPCGKILDGGVRLARNYSTRQSKGFGYVEFKNPEGAHSAVHRAAKPFGLVVMGRPCFVDYDEGSMKGSYKTGDGKLWSREHGNKSAGGGGGRRR